MVATTKSTVHAARNTSSSSNEESSSSLRRSHHHHGTIDDRIKNEDDDHLQRQYRTPQVLNNMAVRYIELGLYDKAAVLLAEALYSCPSQIVSSRSSCSSKLRTDACSCPHCTLDRCIAYSEERATRAAAKVRGTIRKSNGSSNSNINHTAKKQKVLQQQQQSLPTLFQEHHYGDVLLEDETETKVDYIHRKPIYVPPPTIKEGHVMMGRTTLSLIITFNLALVNHLKVISFLAKQNTKTSKFDTDSTADTDTDNDIDAATRERLRNVLRWYEIAYEIQNALCHEKWSKNSSSSTSNTNDSSYEEEKQQESQEQHQHHQSHYHEGDYSDPQQQQQQQSIARSTAATTINSTSSTSTASPCNSNSNNSGCSISNSIRFNMIVCNNISQIHRMANNHLKQEQCLQRLLEMLMFVIDGQRDSISSLDNEQRQHQRQRQRQQERRPSSLEQQQQQQLPASVGNRKRRSRCMDLDGFLHNVTPLVLNIGCATPA
uniref:Uncharacterized protein n=1 Tax=Pseudo-nitzschia australis TaxID=44445 RepID=A0A7S4EII3_9STRA